RIAAHSSPTAPVASIFGPNARPILRGLVRPALQRRTTVSPMVTATGRGPRSIAVLIAQFLRAPLFLRLARAKGGTGVGAWHPVRILGPIGPPVMGSLVRTESR